MNRPLLAVAAVAVILGLVLMVTLAPDTGPPVEPKPPSVVRTPPRTRPSAKPPTEPSLPTVEVNDDEAFQPPPPRAPAPLPPVDPDQVFGAELRGLAGAAVSRRDRFQACWTAYSKGPTDPEFGGRLTVRITVVEVGDHGEATTEVVNGPADSAFEACMGEVMADAKFDSPGEKNVTMMWPVPIQTD